MHQKTTARVRQERPQITNRLKIDKTADYGQIRTCAYKDHICDWKAHRIEVQIIHKNGTIYSQQTVYNSS